MNQAWQAVRIQGIAALRYQSPAGDSVAVALQGAQVLSWRTADGADGVERLYLSPCSAADGHSAIRGGIPVCFPQFNQRGPAPGLPKHGFARNLPWQVAQQGDGVLEMVLHSSEATHAWWPESFEARLSVMLAPNRLRVRLRATVMSFGFKYGIPVDADMVADARFGAPGMETGEGLFSVHEKSFNHVSSRYHSWMPRAMFFNGDEAVHYSPDFASVGYLRGSHGCVGVRDMEKATWLFGQVPVGTRVYVYWS